MIRGSLLICFFYLNLQKDNKNYRMDMMDIATAQEQAKKFVIKGGHPLKGRIAVKGSKNAALPILAACLLTEEPCIIGNIPLIQDVFRMIELLEGIGADIEWLNKRTLRIQARKIYPDRLNYKIVSRFRASILTAGPLLARFGELKIPQPGGCKIGARKIDTHLKAFQDLGVKYKVERAKERGLEGRDVYLLKQEERNSNREREIILDGFSVTATENILLSSCLREGRTIIKIAAAEPHVQDLCAVLSKMGADIQGVGTHTLIVRGRKTLSGVEHFLLPDYLEAGTFLALAIATKSRMTIAGLDVSHLDMVVRKLRDMNACFEIERSAKRYQDKIHIRPSSRLRAVRIEARPYPGFPTDLQAPFGVLATQAEGTTLIFDTLYEGRLRYIEELQKMGANAIIADPHRGFITGPTPLFGREIESFDIRTGATLIIAGLVAEGVTYIGNVYQIYRGYEDIDQRLRSLGADIKAI